ncbi:hypothetical protein E2I00_004629 [Balaenoptera physalus]|uniref:Uncharacterized protein n=1 Tax=Balaenoptera physalus TaxID=9770 RepID=A0A643BXK1_BALPH|nr:hypothetical protein E2I00_004629 [Balaenoptera physalus]
MSVLSEEPPGARQGLKPWILTGTLWRVGLSCRMPLATRWQHGTGEEGPWRKGPDCSTALGAVWLWAQVLQPPSSIIALVCLPQILDFPRLDDHRRKLTQLNLSPSPCVTTKRNVTNPAQPRLTLTPIQAPGLATGEDHNESFIDFLQTLLVGSAEERWASAGQSGRCLVDPRCGSKQPHTTTGAHIGSCERSTHV